MATQARIKAIEYPEEIFDPIPGESQVFLDYASKTLSWVSPNPENPTDVYRFELTLPEIGTDPPEVIVSPDGTETARSVSFLSNLHPDMGPEIKIKRERNSVWEVTTIIIEDSALK